MKEIMLSKSNRKSKYKWVNIIWTTVRKHISNYSDDISYTSSRKKESVLIFAQNPKQDQYLRHFGLDNGHIEIGIWKVLLLRSSRFSPFLGIFGPLKMRKIRQNLELRKSKRSLIGTGNYLAKEAATTDLAFEFEKKLKHSPILHFESSGWVTAGPPDHPRPPRPKNYDFSSVLNFA